MCPMCASTLAWIVFGGGSSAGLGALIFWGRARKGEEHHDENDE